MMELIYEKRWDILWVSALLALVLSFMNILLYVFVNTPVVVFSYPGHDCIRVEFADPQFSCENLPPRFEEQLMVIK